VGHPTLERWYRDYNRKYFSAALPETGAVRMWHAPLRKECGASRYGCVWGFECDAEQWDLHLDDWLKEHEPFAKICLLHEMVHIKLWPFRFHGKKFNAEIERLVLSGAYRDLL
jgi:hypothetical protein